MKTLDEVIKGLRCTDPEVDPETKCNDCPYKEFRISDLWYVGPSCLDVMFADARHYLKEYQKDKQIYSYDIARRHFELAERNDPLAWDELRQMEGKPVWVELTFPEGAYSHWGIIWGFPKAGYEFMELWGFHEIQSFSVMQKEQGKTWQAYRKERS